MYREDAMDGWLDSTQCIHKQERVSIVVQLKLQISSALSTENISRYKIVFVLTDNARFTLWYLFRYLVSNRFFFQNFFCQQVSIFIKKGLMNDKYVICLHNNNYNCYFSPPLAETVLRLTKIIHISWPFGPTIVSAQIYKWTYRFWYLFILALVSKWYLLDTKTFLDTWCEPCISLIKCNQNVIDFKTISRCWQV